MSAEDEKDLAGETPEGTPARESGGEKSPLPKPRRKKRLPKKRAAGKAPASDGETGAKAKKAAKAESEHGRGQRRPAGDAESARAKPNAPPKKPSRAKPQHQAAAARPKSRQSAGRGASPPKRPRAVQPLPSKAPPRARVVRAHARYVRTSARKARMVCGHIRGKSIEEARAILAFTPRDVARDWSKLLESAVANAESNHELLEDDLIVREAYADEGPTIKRFRPRAMGRATPIRKRTSHLTITLTPRPEPGTNKRHG